MKITKFLPVLGILLIIYLVVKVGPGKIVSSLAGMDSIMLIPALVMIIPYFVFQIAKWRYILDAQDIKLGMGYLSKLYMIGAFWGLVTPGKVGSFIKAKYMKQKTGKSLAKCSSSIIFEKIIDLVVLFLLSIAGIFLLGGELVGYVYIIVLLFLLFVIFMLLITKKNLVRVIFGLLFRRLMPEKMMPAARKTFDEFYDSLPSAINLVIPVIFSVVAWVSSYSTYFIIGSALGMDIPYMIFITSMPIATLLGLIPVTISGWGTREAVLIGLFSVFAVTGEQIIAMTATGYVLIGILPCLLGVIFQVRSQRHNL